jgi:hypothetical protein
MGKIFKAIGSLFSPTKIPTLEAPSIPDPDSAASKIAAQGRVAKRKKEGRDGTIYSSSGGSYGGSNLGGTA